MNNATIPGNLSLKPLTTHGKLLSSHPFMMKPIEEIFPLLSEPRQIAITMHQKPDADAMGSTLALKHFLALLGHTVTVISPTNWTGWVNWLPGAREVMDYEKNKKKNETGVDYTDG